jgi:hypothetical protein
MPQVKSIGLRCQILPGGFSGERVIEINLPDGTKYRGLAPRHYCWTSDGKPLSPDEPAPGKSLSGIVAARVLERDNNGQIRVTIPDGEIFDVSEGGIVDRPNSELVSNVSI